MKHFSTKYQKQYTHEKKMSREEHSCYLLQAFFLLLLLLLKPCVAMTELYEKQNIL